MKLYKYTMLYTDGTTKDLGVSKKKTLKELYQLLDCTTVQIIPPDYYKGKIKGRCTMWSDEEARLKGLPTNKHFNILEDKIFGDSWDVVGDVIKEEVNHADISSL